MGMVYDFIMYQGSNTEINQNLQTIFEIGGSIVLQLAEGIKKNSQCLYFDNFFSSYQLFKRSYHLGIYVAGTIRSNRFAIYPNLSVTG